MQETGLAVLIKFILGGLYAGFGGLVHYLYQKTKDGSAPFSWFFFMVNLIVAFFIGQVAWDFIPPTLQAKGGIMMLAGFFAYPILDFMEKHVLNTTLKRIFGIK